MFVQGYTNYKAALYELSFRPKMYEAVRFKDWISSKVIPTIRKSGSYIVDTKTKKKHEDVNKTLKTYKKHINVLENNQKKERYPEGGYIYMIRTLENDKKKFKIGKTYKNLNLRLNTYNIAR